MLGSPDISSRIETAPFILTASSCLSLVRLAFTCSTAERMFLGTVLSCTISSSMLYMADISIESLRCAFMMLSQLLKLVMRFFHLFLGFLFVTLQSLYAQLRFLLLFFQFFLHYSQRGLNHYRADRTVDFFPATILKILKRLLYLVQLYNIGLFLASDTLKLLAVRLQLAHCFLQFAHRITPSRAF